MTSDPITVPADVRRLRRAAIVVLSTVALVGAVLSWQSLYERARPVFGDTLAKGFPLLLDALILGASLAYVAGAKMGRPRPGWRLIAHAGVAGTIALNALASDSLGNVPWHVVPAAVWSALVEITAREVLGQWRATHDTISDKIPGRLWLTAPVESVRTWLRMARTGQDQHAAARLEVGVNAAAREALRLALRGRRSRRVRRILGRHLRAGSLPPAAVLGPLGWGGSDAVARTPEAVLRASLEAILTPPQRPARLAARPAHPEAQNGTASAGEAAQEVAGYPDRGAVVTELADRIRRGQVLESLVVLGARYGRAKSAMGDIVKDARKDARAAAADEDDDGERVADVTPLRERAGR